MLWSLMTEQQPGVHIDEGVGAGVPAHLGGRGCRNSSARGQFAIGSGDLSASSCPLKLANSPRHNSEANRLPSKTVRLERASLALSPDLLSYRCRRCVGLGHEGKEAARNFAFQVADFEVADLLLAQDELSKSCSSEVSLCPPNRSTAYFSRSSESQWVSSFSGDTIASPFAAHPSSAPSYR